MAAQWHHGVLVLESESTLFQMYPERRMFSHSTTPGITTPGCPPSTLKPPTSLPPGPPLPAQLDSSEWCGLLKPQNLGSTIYKKAYHSQFLSIPQSVVLFFLHDPNTLISLHVLPTRLLCKKGSYPLHATAAFLSSSSGLQTLQLPCSVPLIV